MSGVDWGSVTAFVSAVGVFVAAIGTAAAKIAGCINELRRQQVKTQAQAVRARVETEAAGNKAEEHAIRVREDVANVADKLDRLSMAFIDRATATDGQLGRINTRIARLESKE